MNFIESRYCGYRGWVAWPPALGWENACMLDREYLDIRNDTKGDISANLVYGPVLSEMLLRNP